MAKKILINFANPPYIKAQLFNSKTGLNIGGFDEAIECNPTMIATSFSEINRDILSSQRGAGYWLWKPYFILAALHNAKDNDLLMYCDSASHFVSSARPLLDLPEIYDQDVIPFELELIEKEWTKRDAFIMMNCDSQIYADTAQRLASFIVIKKSEFSINFFNEYLRFGCNINIISDEENISGKPNYPEFKSHRHDQSIFSLLSKKHNLTSFRDPSQWGNKREGFINSNYPQIIEHTRQKNPKQSKLKYRIKKIIKKLSSFQ